MGDKAQTHQDMNNAAFSTNNQMLEFGLVDSPPVDPQATQSPAYTPVQMNQVLSEALSPCPAPPPLDFSFQNCIFDGELSIEGPNKGSEERDDDASAATWHTLATTPPRRDKVYDGKIPETPRRFPESSPVRPLPSSPPLNMSHARTFTVEASFLQAMSGVLERRAKIVPDGMLTEAEVRKIVLNELKKRDDAEAAQEKEGALALETLEHRLNDVSLAVALTSFAAFGAIRGISSKSLGGIPWIARTALGGGLLGLLATLRGGGMGGIFQKFFGTNQGQK